ncbi:glycosyltransferase family 4 protein [Solidesulfovibrio carbinolicus]|uniref:Glycosyl transferase family 1 n=1 Tax=Solidesulfovibrio carbinolicus TaxID=296842 RepID=A0A4P6HVM2_9BACT|nr:glycosyltransferase [Solidesulfovibrio carbinolicus]QAZ69578.1 hypothetical protein C3Y92_20020 [Solidesulfovibrio carbinolicus]
MAGRRRLAFVGGLSDKKLVQKLLPLTRLEGVDAIDVYRRLPPPALPKIHWKPLPPGALAGEPAKLARLLAEGWRYEALIGCFQLYHGFWAHLAGRLWRRPTIQLVIDNLPGNLRQYPSRTAIMAAAGCGVRGPRTLLELRQAGYARPAAIIHNPYALPEPMATPAERRFDCIAVGNFNTWKDYPWLATVFEALAAQGIRPRLALGGLFPDAFQARMRAACGDRVHFLGHLGPKALDAAYAASRSLLMTSQAEGLPMVAVEAMSHGLPVIATTVGDLPWLVRDGREGRLVPHGDTAAMAAAIAALLADPDGFEAMGQAAAVRVRELAPEFTPDRIVAAWRALFDQLGFSA